METFVVDGKWFSLHDTRYIMPVALEEEDEEEEEAGGDDDDGDENENDDDEWDEDDLDADGDDEEEWPRAACEEGEGGDDNNEGDNDDDDDDDDPEGGGGGGGGGDPAAAARRQRRVPGGLCFERFEFATRKSARRGTAAYARLGKPYYGVVDKSLVLNRAPLHPPFFATAETQRAWQPDPSPAMVRQGVKRGYWLYNMDATQS